MMESLGKINAEIVVPAVAVKGRMFKLTTQNSPDLKQIAGLDN
jgi:hypothetical protein